MVVTTRQSGRVKHYNHLRQTLCRTTFGLDNILTKIDHGGRLSLFKLLKVISKINMIRNSSISGTPDDFLELQNLLDQVQDLSRTHLMFESSIKEFQNDLKYIITALYDYAPRKVRRNKK